MEKEKDFHALLWDLIRVNGNNKTAAAKKMGMRRQNFNYYVNEAKKLSDEFMRKVTVALMESNSSEMQILIDESPQADIKKVLKIVSEHADLIQLEKESQLPLKKMIEEILYAALV